MVNKLQASIIKHLKGLNFCWVIKVIVANERGCPDILCCYRGRFYAIEVKNEGDKLSPIQSVQIEKINKSMGMAFEARSLNDVKKVINSL